MVMLQKLAQIDAKRAHSGSTIFDELAVRFNEQADGSKRMKKSRSGSRSDYLAKWVFAAAVCGAIPFLFVHGVWGEFVQKAYLLTALLLFILLWSNWESTSERWFWKAMVAIVLVHSGVVLGIAKVNLEFPDIDRLPRMVYGALSLILAAETLGSMRLIEAFRPKQKTHRYKPEDRPDETV